MLDVQTSNGASAPRVLPRGNAVTLRTTLFPQGAGAAAEFKRSGLTTYQPSKELVALSSWIGRMQALAQKEFGYASLWIAGGSSRTILDHVYFKKPLKMRDLDIFFVAGKREAEATAWRLADRIQESGIARFERRVIRQKSRVNPNLPTSEQLGYQAGFGMHLLHDTFPILSLSIFHERKDLELNGIMNVDKIMIRLDSRQALTTFCATELVGTPYWQLANKNVIDDKFNGYQAWVEQRPEVLNWLSLFVEPPMKSIRVLRSFAKCGHTTLPTPVKEKMKALVINAHPPKDPFEMMRSFLKILSDKLVAPQLSMLASIGTLAFLCPELQSNLEGMSADEITLLINEGKYMQSGTELAEPLKVLRSLTTNLRPEAREQIFALAQEAYPTTFA